MASPAFPMEVLCVHSDGSFYHGRLLSSCYFVKHWKHCVTDTRSTEFPEWREDDASIPHQDREYGTKNSRQTWIEAKHAGIHPFCITNDTQAHDYLPQMHWHVSYTREWCSEIAGKGVGYLSKIDNVNIYCDLVVNYLSFRPNQVICYCMNQTGIAIVAFELGGFCLHGIASLSYGIALRPWRWQPFLWTGFVSMTSPAFLMEVHCVHDNGSLSYGQVLSSWHRQPFLWKCTASMTMAVFPMDRFCLHGIARLFYGSAFRI